MIPLGVLASARVAAAGGGGSAVTFLESRNYGFAAGRTSWTFGAVALGPASSDRVIIVAIAARSTPPIASVTIGGVTATIDVQNGTDVNTAIARAAVPTGETGDIVVTAGNTGNNCSIGAYAVTGHAVSVVDTDAASSNTRTVTPATPGLVVAVTHTASNGGTCTWSGVTEDWDIEEDLSGAPNYAASGGHALTSSTGDLTVTGTMTGNLYQRISVAAYSLT